MCVHSFTPAEIVQMDAWASYVTNCGPRAGECAKRDLLGQLLKACKALVRVAELVPIFQIGDGLQALELGIAAIVAANTESSDDPQTTKEPERD